MAQCHGLALSRPLEGCHEGLQATDCILGGVRSGRTACRSIGKKGCWNRMLFFAVVWKQLSETSRPLEQAVDSQKEKVNKVPGHLVSVLWTFLDTFFFPPNKIFFGNLGCKSDKKQWIDTLESFNIIFKCLKHSFFLKALGFWTSRAWRRAASISLLLLVFAARDPVH